MSTAGQASSGIGLDAQRSAITAAAATRGFTITEWFEDAGKSGGTMKNRTGLRSALEAVHAGRADGIVAAKVDRLGRSSADVLGLVEQAQREGWRLLVLDVGIDSATRGGELVVAALAMAARFEYRRISERQREKFGEMRRRGQARGRPAAPREVAARIAARRDAGLTLRTIAAELNAAAVPTVRGGTAWRASSVRSALITYDRERAEQAGG